jgi:dTDP-4-amino-4,6-dideoxygalactose transaminase
MWNESDLNSLKEVLESGQWNVASPKVSEFEEKFAAYVGVKHSICVTNGTMALVIALIAADVCPGDEVIIPPYTFTATAGAVVMMNAIPIFADIDSGTYNLDPKEMEKVITDKTKVVIPVHVAGGPADMDGIMKVARKHKLMVIEDACQAHAAEWRGKKVGSIGDIGCFSFQASKNLCAGEGGIITTNNKKLADECWSYHNCGRVRGGARYEQRGLGANFRMTAWQAAILLAQMERLDEQTETRNRNGLYLSEKLSEIEGIKPARRDESVTKHAYHLYMFRYDAEKFGGQPRARFLEALSAEGIPCSRGYHPLYKQDFFKTPIQRPDGSVVDYSKLCLPVVEKACNEEAVWLKQSMLLGKQADMDDVVKAIGKIKENFAG